MKFRTEYKPVKSTLTLDPSRPLIMLGSCFSDNITGRMRECMWHASNPAGTLYNPVSIARAIGLFMEDDDPAGEFGRTLFDSCGIWHSWMFDTKMSDRQREGCVGKFISARRRFLRDIRKSQALFVTFGTSYVYYLSETPQHIVGNCHKQPSSAFGRRRLAVEEIVAIWEETIARLNASYPQLNVIFTVSPVRHIKDGMVENNRSKAVLQLAVEELCEMHGCCSYFPAYELVNDDLRDYRFYASDLVHPSEQAVTYVWEVFRSVYLDEAGEAKLRAGESVIRRRRHRPLVK